MVSTAVVVEMLALEVAVMALSLAAPQPPQPGRLVHLNAAVGEHLMVKNFELVRPPGY